MNNDAEFCDYFQSKKNDEIEEDKMSAKYQVFYHRDLKTEKSKNYGNKMLYDYAKEFYSKESAHIFVYKNLPALLIKKISSPIQSENKPEKYIVAAKFIGKYHHYDYGGGCDALTNYDILRVDKSKLEETVEKFASEDNIEDIIIGIEEKLF